MLRLLAKAHLDLGRARSRACCRLHALVAELVAGGIRKEVVVSQAESLLAAIDPEAAQHQRLALASELLDDIRALDVRLKTSKHRITTAVVAAGTTLTDLYGVGPVVAAIVIGYSGDVPGFPPLATTRPTTGPRRSSSVPVVAPCTGSRGAGTGP